MSLPNSSHEATLPVPVQSTETSADGKESFPIVGIGASAGGLEAFTQLLAHLPEKTGMAFVLVQHLDPAHESQLAELLSKATRLPVTEVTDGMAVSPDHVYVIPPNANMAIAQGVLQLTPRGDGARPAPAGRFLLPLAGRGPAEPGHRRGPLGHRLRRHAGAGGDQGGRRHHLRPGREVRPSTPACRASAVASGCVDFVLPPDEIARELARIGRHPVPARPRPAAEAEAEPPSGGVSAKILGRLRSATGVDFSHYRDTTIQRRIARRMALHKQESLRGLRAASWRPTRPRSRPSTATS